MQFGPALTVTGLINKTKKINIFFEISSYKHNSPPLNSITSKGCDEFMHNHIVWKCLTNKIVKDPQHIFKVI